MVFLPAGGSRDKLAFSSCLGSALRTLLALNRHEDSLKEENQKDLRNAVCRGSRIFARIARWDGSNRSAARPTFKSTTGGKHAGSQRTTVLLTFPISTQGTTANFPDAVCR
jgi:hypothetical protein